MDADIFNYVSQCHVCSLWSKTTGESPYPTISEPIHLDVVLHRHYLEYSHALSFINMATDYPVVILLSFTFNDQDVKSAFVTHWLTLFGAPKCMIADNATTFFLLFDTLQPRFGTIIQVKCLPTLKAMDKSNESIVL